MISRRVGQIARPHEIEVLLLLLGPRRTARSGLRGTGRLWARRVELGKLGVLESRIGVMGVFRKLSNLLLGWGLRRRSGGYRANRIWNIGILGLEWTGQDVFLIIYYKVEMKIIL